MHKRIILVQYQIPFFLGNMPPKKRKRGLPAKPGKIRQYLMDNFGIFPSSRNEIRVGHILCLFVEKERSLVGTIRAMQERCESMKLTARQLKSLVQKSLDKYKNVSREAEMDKFDELCREMFSASQLPPPDPPNSTAESTFGESPMTLVPRPSTSTTPMDQPTPSGTLVGEPSALMTAVGEPATTPSTSPLPSTSSGRSSRSDFWTPRKQALKRRLDFVSKSASKLKKMHLDSLKNLRAKLRVNQVKTLNQAIKRKQATIKKLRRQIVASDVVRKLAETKKKLVQLAQKHRRLKNRRKVPSAATSCTRCNVVGKEIERLNQEVQSRNLTILTLENDKLDLQEKVIDLEGSGRSSLTKEGCTYSQDMRMLVYDSIVNHVPTRNIPNLIRQFAKRSGMDAEHVPHRNTVELMARELGVVSDFQVAELLMTGNDLTLGFDATTQEGVHVNEVHITSEQESLVISVDDLPGGLAEDYELHIVDSINRVAEVYDAFHEDVDFETCRSKMVRGIKNTLTDRATVNHATIARIENTWGKSLNELNCHLHPLDTIASSSRSTLKAAENQKGKLFGTDCIAGNIVLAMNKFRFKDGKGDPKGFKTFLDRENLPRGLIPRYRGNRLHVLFHLCGIYVRCHDVFTKFLATGTVSCGGLQAAIFSDFQLPVAKLEMQVLGLIGKLLTGPWISKFYVTADCEISHVDGISIVKAIIMTLKSYIKTPKETLSTKVDFFGQPLKDEVPLVTQLEAHGQLLKDESTVLQKLQEDPVDAALFAVMMQQCLSGIVAVLERQYKKYLELDLTEELRKETRSARCHNIDAEEIMGMFSAAKSHAPNATLCYLSCTIRARKNRVVDYLDSLEVEKREKLLKLAVSLAREQRVTKRKRSAQIKAVLSKRMAAKMQKKQTLQRSKIEKKLRSPNFKISADTEFGHIDPENQKSVQDILDGKVVGRQICHIWYDEDTESKTLFNGKIEKLKKKGGGTYVVGYWDETKGETYQEAEDIDISKFALAADLICDDLTIS